MITRKLIVSLVVPLFINLATHAQEVIGVTGLSVHSMQKLKTFQKNYINDAVVNLKSTQSFPPFFQHGVIVRFSTNNAWKPGVYAYGTSTAARSVYEDYSGMIKVDQSLRCLGMGFYSAFLLTQQGRGKVSAYCVAGIDASKLTVALDIRVGAGRENSNETYTATSAMAEAGLEYIQSLGSSNLSVTFSGGVHFSQEVMLRNSQSENEWENVSWTGGKLMVGVCYAFQKH